MTAWLRKKYAAYTPSGKMWLTVGVACLVVDMMIGYLAGYSIATFWHGVGYAALACGFAFLPDAAYEEFEGGRYISCAIMGLLCIPIGVKAYEQQLTYSAGMRSGEMQTVSVVNTKYDGAQASVSEDKANLELWQKQLATLTEQNAWAPTVKADAMRAELATLRARVDEEKNGKRGRRAGCGKECERLQNEANALEARIGIAEQASTLSKQIAATQRVLDSKREAASKAEHKTSLNVDVAKTTARLLKIATGASAQEAVRDDEVTSQLAMLGSAGLGSLALLLLAPTGIFLAGRRRRHEDGIAHEEKPASGATGVTNVVNRTVNTFVDPFLGKALAHNGV